jgi:hypothetical protein
LVAILAHEFHAGYRIGWKQTVLDEKASHMAHALAPPSQLAPLPPGLAPLQSVGDKHALVVCKFSWLWEHVDSSVQFHWGLSEFIFLE